ncbi:hypothetical protein BVRB_2g037920 [Beta vulgaris subsp. vulgaris]|nr:hypothetical protein BVRB_2g037920 [Beta vulgaris subsp. vulgaris]
MLLADATPHSSLIGVAVVLHQCLCVGAAHYRFPFFNLRGRWCCCYLFAT